MTWERALLFCLFVMVYSVVEYALGSAFVLFAFSGISVYAKILGAVSAIGMSVGALPQIWKTYLIKTDAAVSIVSNMIQAPGAGLVGYFLLIANPNDISVWGPYAVGFVLQMFLLIELCYYRYLYHRFFAQKRPETHLDDDFDDQEEDPLLVN